MAVDVEKLVSNVRTYLLDDPNTNDLIDDYETLEAAVKLAFQKMVAEINVIPPMLSFRITPNHMSDSSVLAFMDGIIAHLYFGLAAKEKRNQLQARDTGAFVDDSHRSESYLQLYQMKMMEFRKMISDVKQAEAGKEAFGVVCSPYSFIRTFDIYGGSTGPDYFK